MTGLVPCCDLSARGDRPRPGWRSWPDQEPDHLASAAPGVSHHSPAEPSSRTGTTSRPTKERTHEQSDRSARGGRCRHRAGPPEAGRATQRREVRPPRRDSCCTWSDVATAVGNSPQRGRTPSPFGAAAFAMLAGVAPIPANSGQVTTRYRLSRYGDRQLNNALHTVVQSRIQYQQATRDYVDRRTAKGKTPPRDQTLPGPLRRPRHLSPTGKHGRSCLTKQRSVALTAAGPEARTTGWARAEPDVDQHQRGDNGDQQDQRRPHGPLLGVQRLVHGGTFTGLVAVAGVVAELVVGHWCRRRFGRAGVAAAAPRPEPTCATTSASSPSDAAPERRLHSSRDAGRSFDTRDPHADTWRKGRAAPGPVLGSTVRLRARPPLGENLHAGRAELAWM